MYVLYDGPSMITGEPILGIITYYSSNPKTGPMDQLWILNKNESPMTSLATGADRNICGDCHYRGNKGRHRACYVNPSQGPTAVWHKWAKGAPQRRRTTNNYLRLGAYGDPTAIPVDILLNEITGRQGVTGYTQRWMFDIDPRYKEFLMASCMSEEQVQQANNLGWATFRTKNKYERQMPNELYCPNGKEKSFQCIDCKKCSGNTAPNIVINVHGAVWKHTAFKKAQKAQHDTTIPIHSTGMVIQHTKTVREVPSLSISSQDNEGTSARKSA